MNGLRDKILILIIAALAGTGGTIAYRQISPPAPDRFTGSEGRQHEIRIESHEVRLKALESANERLFMLQEQIREVMHRIEVDIARLPPDEWRERIRKLEREVGKGHIHQNE